MSWAQLIEQAVTIRRQLHRIPELCWQEERTAAAIGERLDQLAIGWRRCAETGIVARLGAGKAGPHVALRADMDGLKLAEESELPWKSTRPDCMHACGHDGHMAALLATAEWLKRQEDRLPGPVSFLFQPAEEGGHGAREMIADGALDGVEKIFGWHNWPTIPFGRGVCPAGPVMAANASFTIEIVGSGGHASQPELCRDPVLAAAAVTLGLQQLVSRRTAPQEAVVVSVTSIDARSTETAIPDRAVLAGTIRLASTGGLHQLGDLLAATARSIAAGYHTRAEVDFRPRYPAVVNDGAQAQRVRQAVSEVFGPDWVHSPTRLPLMASEDFSYYLEKVPGAFLIVGGGDDGIFSIPCHNSRYVFNDLLLDPMIRVMVRLAGGISG